jgi:hypothetical protein
MKTLRADKTDLASLRNLEMYALDITGAEVVQLQIRHDKDVVWVNVNGVCMLRICAIKKLETEVF